MLHKLPTHILLCITVGLILNGCDSANSEDSFPIDRNLTEQEQRIVQADNSFGLKLYKALHEDNPTDNLFISPLSVSMALGMALNGADGETRDEMIRVLEKSRLIGAGD